jgi:hypothetical protein
MRGLMARGWWYADRRWRWWWSNLVFQIGERNLVWVERSPRRRSSRFRYRGDLNFFIINSYLVWIPRGFKCSRNLSFIVVDDYLVRVAFYLLDGNWFAVNDTGLKTRMQVCREPPLGLEVPQQIEEWR